MPIANRAGLALFAESAIGDWQSAIQGGRARVTNQPFDEPERRTPMRLVGNYFASSRIGVRRSDQVRGRDARPKLEVEALHDPGRADLRVGLDAQQRVPATSMAPMGDLTIEEVIHNARYAKSALILRRAFQRVSGAAFGAPEHLVLHALVVFPDEVFRLGFGWIDDHCRPLQVFNQAARAE